MNNASDLIERMERETGQRIDDNDGDNFAMAGLFGALARALGTSPHQSRDDVAAGVVIRHQMTPEYKSQKQSEKLLASMLVSGLSPDDAKNLLK